jgi:CHAD domain-containing protein
MVRQFDHFLTREHGRALQGAAGFRRALVRERERARRALGEDRGLSGTRECLSAAQTRASHWRVPRKNWSALGTGICATYRRGRKALAAARSGRTDASLHEWRKQAKYLHHQLQLLRPAWPGPLGNLVKELHELGDLLGDDHDLAVLRSKALANPSLRDGGERHVISRLDMRRVSLQHKALSVGEHLYRRKPKYFAKKLGRRWRSWHDR